MKILITGGNGQLGRELTEILTKQKSVLGELEIFRKNIYLTSAGKDRLDITEHERVFEVISAGRYDVVINCAAYTNVDGCENDEKTAFSVNTIGVKNLGEAVEKVGGRLIHISTDYVFDGKKTSPYTEEDECSPLNNYGKTKYLGELCALEACNNTAVVRSSWLYGAGGKSFVRTILALAGTQREVKVADDQRGTPTSCDELAFHILKLAVCDYCGIFHCSADGDCTWYDLAKKIVRLSGSDCEIIPCSSKEINRPAKRPCYSVLENQRLKQTVGDSMSFWEEAIERFIYSLKKAGEV
ncbi:MAG: dTDP-4-dehydrorhamnose reductase [Oscillospiraceae bacterium]